MGLLDLRLVPQLIQEKGFLPDLDVVAEEECDRELKKDEEISSQSKTLFSYPQSPDAEGGMAKDENIRIIFIHEKPLSLSLRPSASSCTATIQGLQQALPVKSESKNQTFSRMKGLHSFPKTRAHSSDQMRSRLP